MSIPSKQYCSRKKAENIDKQNEKEFENEKQFLTWRKARENEEDEIVREKKRSRGQLYGRESPFPLVFRTQRLAAEYRLVFKEHENSVQN